MGWSRSFTRSVVAGLLFASAAMAQETPAAKKIETPKQYEVRRAAGEIKIDGELSDPGWTGVNPMPLLVETFPADNQAPPVRTEALVTYDTANVYVAIRAFDPRPSEIRAHLTDRDRAFSDDFVGVVFDTFNDERRGFEFFVNPLGVQMDLFQDDVAGNEDSTWDAIWDSAGRITAEGYVVEFAVPFSSLRFKETAGTQTWGIDVVRIYPRNQRHRIGLNTLDRDRNCYICEFAKLTGFEGISPGKNLELTPTLTTHRTDFAPTFPQGGLSSGDEEFDAGLSAKWGFTPNLTLNAAINPDFSQVEADSPQLDINTQFTLFFEEKRPFFLEGADFFRTPLQVVYTRTVADPDWGGKVSGKEGRSAIGAFVAQDTITNIVIPGSQGSAFTFIDDTNTSGVLRYRHDIGDNSNIGLIATGRSANDYSNILGGIDGNFRIAKSDTITTQLLWSATEYPSGIAAQFGQPLGSLQDPAFRASYRHSTKNVFLGAFYDDIGTQFRADSGFMPQVDFRRGEIVGEYVWWGNDKTWYSRYFVSGNWDRTERKSDGRLLEDEKEGYVGFAGPKQSFFLVGGGMRERFFNGVTFDENFYSVVFEISPSGSLYFSLEGTVRDEIDFVHTRAGDRVNFTPFIRYNLGRQTLLELRHNYDILDVEGGRLFTANLTQLRAVYQFNIRTFLRAIVQYTDIEQNPSLYRFEVAPETRRLFPQVLFSYKINPQTVFFAGYTENRLGDHIIDLTQRDRTFFTKIGYAWLF
jgi:hypothetical protein